MINQDILSYIREQIKLGSSRDLIREVLSTKGGWRLPDIEEAFKFIDASAIPVQSVAPAPAPAPIIPPTPKPTVEVPVTFAPKIVTATPAPEKIEFMPTMQPKVAPAPAPAPAPAFQMPQSVMQPVKPIMPVVDVVAKPSTPMQSIPMSVMPQMTQAPKPSPSTLYQPTRADVMPSFSGISASDMIGKAQPQTKGKKLALVFAILLMVVLFGGGVVYGYFYYIAPTPVNAFARMVMNFKNSETGHYTATIVADFDKSIAANLIPAPTGLTPANFSAESTTGSAAQATVTIDGMYDQTDLASQKNRNTFNFTTTLAPVNLSFETRLIGDTLYLKTPDLGFLADVIGTDTLGFMPGDWIKLSRPDLVRLAEDAPEVQILPHMQNGSLTAKLTDAQKTKIQNLFLESGVITPTIALPRTNVEGVSINKYQFTINKESLKSAIEQTYTIVSGGPVLPSMTNAINQEIDNINIANGEISIGTWDGILRAVSFDIEPSGQSGLGPVSLKFSIVFDNFGQSVSITPPNSSQPFVDILEDARKKGKDSSIKANINSVKYQADLFYSQKRSYLGFCTSDTGLKPTITALSSLIAPESVFCKDGAKTFVIASPIIAEGGFYCIDNKGTALSIKALPAGNICE